MKFYAVDHSCEPKIIGVNDAGPVLEAREYLSGRHTWNTGKKYTETTQHPFSFPSKEAEQYYIDYYNPKHNPVGQGVPAWLYLDSFEPFDTAKCKEILLFKSRKRVKETDWMDAKVMQTYCLNVDCVFSERFLFLLKQFRLPPMNIIPARVDGFDTKYALVDVAEIPEQEIDFTASDFFDDLEEDIIHFKDYNDYMKNWHFEQSYHIVLQKNYPFDVIKIGIYLYFSEPLLEAVKQARITALDVYKFSLDC